MYLNAISAHFSLGSHHFRSTSSLSSVCALIQLLHSITHEHPVITQRHKDVWRKKKAFSPQKKPQVGVLRIRDQGFFPDFKPDPEPISIRININTPTKKDATIKEYFNETNFFLFKRMNSILLCIVAQKQQKYIRI